MSPPTAAPIRRSVALIIHAPRVPSGRNRSVQKLFGWNDPDQLVSEFVKDMRQASHDIAQFELVERLEVDEFPIKADGFQYEPEEFAGAWRRRSGFHEPDLVDYQRLLDQFGIPEMVESGRVDEVWLMAFPYAGYYESIMGGPGAFWCNSPPLSGLEQLSRRFIIMGFNYERGVGEMMESFGHRAESIMAEVNRGKRGRKNLWERFIRHERDHKGGAQVGNIHFAPNSERDYDWGNPRSVLSACDDWYDFPDLSGNSKAVNCEEWGAGDIRLHHMWWYRHLPHVRGETEGILNNWWAYILDPNRVRR